MKLEKINDNQIRCTLNQNDLMDRELKLSELAYGTEKAKDLFRDLMAQASDELGFEAEDIPLVIEAIPVSSDCIILIITKVEDPEELDTRFSRFAPSIAGNSSENEDDLDDDDDDDTLECAGADEILDLFKQLQDGLTKDLDQVKQDTDTDEEVSDEAAEDTEDASIEITRIFSFRTLSDVSLLAGVLDTNTLAENTLYKNPKTGIYYLVMQKGNISPEVFNQICNITTEYGNREKFMYATTAYYEEHYEVIIKNKALQVLAQI